MLDPSFYCSSQFLVDVVQGEWDNDKRVFLSESEKLEGEKLSWTDNMVASNIQFVSIAHKRAMAFEDNSTAMESKLTKKDEAPRRVGKKKTGSPDSDSDVTDDYTHNTGSTRESKAQRYAEEQTKKVIELLDDKLSTLNSKLDERDNMIEALQKQLALQEQNNAGRNSCIFQEDDNDGDDNEEIKEDQGDEVKFCLG